MSDYQKNRAEFERKIKERQAVERGDTVAVIVPKPVVESHVALYDVIVIDDRGVHVAAWNIPGPDEAEVVASRVFKRLIRLPTHDGDGKPLFSITPDCKIRKQGEHHV